MKYALFMPTRGADRKPVLKRNLRRWLDQTAPPSVVVIVDNNEYEDDGRLEFVSELLEEIFLNRKSSLVCEPSRYPVGRPLPGIAHGDKTAHEIVSGFGIEWAVRWDDDLIPRELTFAQQLLGRLAYDFESSRVLAAGGAYPQSDEGRVYYAPTLEDPSIRSTIAPDSHGHRHAQFYLWDDPPIAVPTHFLYSSFAYHVPSMSLVGGFCDEYSPHSYRADTDAMLRINALTGNRWGLRVYPDLVADHLVSAGGTRSITGEEKRRMLASDERLFRKRMRSMNIDPDY